MASKLVLLTGASGYVGFRTLHALLDHGFSVRAVVRSSKKAESIRNEPVLRGTTERDLSFAIVPDLGAAGAYNNVMADVTYIVHVASPPPAEPEPSQTLEDSIVKPAVACTLEVLEAARIAGTVKRVVITSSVIATVPTSLLMGTQHDEAFGPEYRAEEIQAPYMNNAMFAYAASKIAALRRAEEWIAAEKPQFDVIHIHPTYVLGRDARSGSLENYPSSTNDIVLNITQGKQDPMPRVMCSVHVDDVAEAHVRSLDGKVPGNQSFVLNCTYPAHLQWDHVKDIVAEKFPKAVDRGIFPNNGSCTTLPGKVDSSKTEEVLGIKHEDFENQVTSAIGQYLEVWESEKGE
ncbi:uncharacterized protein LTR77_011114 [Saxophila tyrrhenica]|uniref:NAD-dependent epimerase/dehydratase domain-containing protein n=1 Tax=Saxophila tyrrhenica TaxID=1690608 RepID=A0AAV9NTC6_9PEZI|nr:hypothetical protein LTR77_011114 [Saxophila tyrrhenica]